MAINDISNNPLDQKQEAQLIKEALSEARENLVGRKLIHLYGPLHPSMDMVRCGVYSEDQFGKLSLHGDSEFTIVSSDNEDYLPIPSIFKDFFYTERDIKYSQELGIPLDPTVVNRAAHFVAHKEDDLIFHGDQTLGIPGVLSCEGRSRKKIGDWYSKPGKATADVVEAIEILLKSNHHGPFAAVLSPDLYHAIHKFHPGNTMLDVQSLSLLLKKGIFLLPVLKPGQGVIFDPSKQNLDIAIGQDLKLSFMEGKGGTYFYRIEERLVARVKRASSICELYTD